ncbi:MAG: hypothetical protein GTN65_01175 [Armatimonadetes bacterium]|nr:hypothetical protein [Armatimonadota bacterium]NIO95724.1 hypothetical protein [Armatimonadota bacterium]
MRGSVQTPGDFSFDAFMAPTEQVFTALFKGELRAILFPSIQADSPAMLFNRDKVDAIALLPREEVRELEEDEAP